MFAGVPPRAPIPGWETAPSRRPKLPVGRWQDAEQAIPVPGLVP